MNSYDKNSNSEENVVRPKINLYGTDYMGMS